jgi:hypothetical protein
MRIVSSISGVTAVGGFELKFVIGAIGDEGVVGELDGQGQLGAAGVGRPALSRGRHRHR